VYKTVFELQIGFGGFSSVKSITYKNNKKTAQRAVQKLTGGSAIA
jgi:hypothetical protein